MVEPFVASEIASRLLDAAQEGAAHVFKGRRTRRDARRLQAASDRISLELQQLMPALRPALKECLDNYLRSSEFAAIVRQALVTSLRRPASGQQSLIRRSFEFHLSLYCNDDCIDVGTGPALFGMLMSACEHVIETSDLTAAETGPNGYFAQELQAQLDNLELAVSRIDENVVSVREYRPFLAGYRRLVADRHSTITTPHWNSAPRVTLDDVYITTRIAGSGRTREALAALVERVVILGDPGAGKTTLITKVARDAALGVPLLDGRDRIPLVIVLRDYDEMCRRVGTISFLDYIERDAQASYQVMPHPGLFEHLLITGRAIAIFDGLDELVQVARRQEISRSIESLGITYPNVPIIITSRRVGYAEAPLDEKRFRAITLADFTDGDTAAYVNMWFRRDKGMSSVDRGTDRAARFLSTSQSVKDLRRNPLLLALLCNLYVASDYAPLPTTRAGIYERCALTLFDRWDRNRNIAGVDFESAYLPVICHIAGYAYRTGATSIRESDLVSLIANYLVPRRFEEVARGNSVARAMLSHCTGRAWVFSDVGLSPDGEALYNFTHRTFLEYFTALHFARTCRTPDDLVEEFWDEICRSQTTEVTLLAFQIKSRDLIDGSDELIRGLLIRINVENSASAERVLTFAVKCAGVLRLSNAALRQLAGGCWAGVLSGSASRGKLVKALVESLGDTDARMPVLREVLQLLSAEYTRGKLSSVSMAMAQQLDLLGRGAYSAAEAAQLRDILGAQVVRSSGAANYDDAGEF